LVSTIFAGASPAARGMETAADCPVASTVSNRAIAAFFLAPCLVVTATWKGDLGVKNQSPQFYAFPRQHIGWSGRVFKG